MSVSSTEAWGSVRPAPSLRAKGALRLPLLRPDHRVPRSAPVAIPWIPTLDRCADLLPHCWRAYSPTNPYCSSEWFREQDIYARSNRLQKQQSWLERTLYRAGRATLGRAYCNVIPLRVTGGGAPSLARWTWWASGSFGLRPLSSSEADVYRSCSSAMIGLSQAVKLGFPFIPAP